MVIPNQTTAQRTDSRGAWKRSLSIETALELFTYGTDMTTPPHVTAIRIQLARHTVSTATHVAARLFDQG